MDSTCHHHEVFYFTYGHDVYRVDDTLFKLHRDLLIHHSEFFADLFTFPRPPGENQGSSDESPIVLKGLSAAQFEHFLFWLYPHLCDSSSFDIEHWDAVMLIGDMYGVTKARDDACEHVRKRVRYGDESPVVVMDLACQYAIHEWFTEAFRKLVYKDVTSYPFEDVQKLQTRHLFSLLKAQHAVLEYRSLLAFIAPPVTHAQSCVDHEGCYKVFEDGWWRNVGRTVHDPVSPKASTSIEYMLDSFQFPGMEQGCWELTKKQMPHEPFRREQEIIDHAVAHLLPIDRR